MLNWIRKPVHILEWPEFKLAEIVPSYYEGVFSLGI
jgi:hypothetical protein